MAWYTSTTVRFRGRLVACTMRYGVFHYAEVLKGKPFPFELHCSGYGNPSLSKTQERAVRRLEELIERNVLCQKELRLQEEAIFSLS